MNDVENIYDILEHLQKRKAMFLGNNYTFHSLESFISGFAIAAQEDQLQKPGCPNFGYFNLWIIGHLDKHYGSTGGWHWQIHNRNLQDDQKAFEEFFHFLNIFKNSTVTSKVIVVDDEAIQFSSKSPIKRYTGAEMKEEFLEEPYKIRWMQLSNSTTVWLEYLDKNSDHITHNWYINQREATKALKKEFGKFKTDWIKKVDA